MSQRSTFLFLLFSFSISYAMTISNTQRLPTIRKLSSSVPKEEFTNHSTRDRVQKMTERANEGTPFTDEEIKDICNGIKNLSPATTNIDFEMLESVLNEAAHLSHKDWGVTSKNSDKLSRSLSISSDEEQSSSVLSNHAKQLLERILSEGNWEGAAKHSLAKRNQQAKPWAVLVTGCNGIRKTTSMYQPWFQEILSEALCPPGKGEKSMKPEFLPTGANSFFRQLDHMIATLMNEEFFKIYSWAAFCLDQEGSSTPSDKLVEDYSDYKAAVFARYRTLSELLGALLLKQAQRIDINCLCETSGKDVAMFHYVDHFFDTKYNKLALHFTINDLTYAQESVDKRMIEEIQVGSKAVQSEDAFDVIYANAGGPYGSKVLQSVQEESEKVWQRQVLTEVVGKDWYKATISIQAHPNQPWTAQAVKADGTLGTIFTFEPPK